MSAHSTPTQWKNILRFVTKLCIPLVLAGTMVGAIIDGWAGMLGLLSGFALVYLWFAIDILVAQRAEKKALSEVARALMATYIIKVLIGFGLLLLVPHPRLILNGWFLTGAILTVLLWLGGSMRTIMKMRILYFDAHD